MKLHSKFEKKVSSQINIEWNLSYSYLAMAGWFETTPYKGFARWMQRQSMEEQEHAMKLFRYIKDRIGVIDLMKVNAPVSSFKSPLDAFQAALKMEQNSTAHIYELYALAVKERDFETQEHLHWFLQEQIHEEKNVQDIVDKIALAGNKPAAILHLDAHATEQYGDASH
jgi:ferritin